MISDHLYSFLTAQSGITNLVSTRIYPLILPQLPEYPCVTYREDSHSRIEVFSGTNGLTDSTYMIDAFAKTFSEATSVGDAIRTALNNHTGSFGSISICKCTIIGGPIYIYEDDVEAYRQTQIFSIWHTEE